MSDINIKIRFAKSELDLIFAAKVAWDAKDDLEEEGVHRGKVWNDRYYAYKTKTSIVVVCQPDRNKDCGGEP